MPIIIGVLCLVFVGLLGFFGLRACQRGAEQQQAEQAAAQEAAAQQAAAEAKPDYTDINLLMVGDILFHYQVRQSGLQANGTRNYDHVFAHFASELADKDIKVLNQETVLGGSTFPGDAPDGYGSYPQFNGPQEMADAEVKAGFNVILKATNHALDIGYDGLSSELQYWAQNFPEVAVIGAVDPADTSASVDQVYLYEKDGFKVALLNYTFDLNGMEDPNGVMSMLEEQHVASTMATAREAADMIVVFPHWGVEYETTPNAEQRRWAQILIDEGADVIIGNHPHVMQPVELLAGEDGKAVPCYWSTGNFISTSPDDMSLLGGVPELTLRKAADGTCSIPSASMTITATHLGDGSAMTTYLLRDWTDELASTNWLNTEMNPNTNNTTLTPAWANSFCAQVLGSGFDPTTGTFTLDLTATPTKLTSSTTSSATDSSSMGTGAGTSNSTGTSTDGSAGTNVGTGTGNDASTGTGTGTTTTTTSSDGMTGTSMSDDVYGYDSTAYSEDIY